MRMMKLSECLQTSNQNPPMLFLRFEEGLCGVGLPLRDRMKGNDGIKKDN